MTRTHGRAPRGCRLTARVPHGRWTTMTFVAAFHPRFARVLAPVRSPSEQIDTVARPKPAHFTGDQLAAARREAGIHPAPNPASGD